MEPMQRLFGKDLANHHPTRNHSLANPHKPITIHPNASFKITKNLTLKYEPKNQDNLTEMLTEYFD